MDDLTALLERAELAISNSQRLATENQRLTAESRWWIQRLCWISDEMRSKAEHASRATLN